MNRRRRPAVAATTESVACEVRIAAPREVVFGFLIDPDKLIRWKGVEAELDPRPGGDYFVNVTGRDAVRGTFVEVTPPDRVVFTWGWEAAGHPVPPGSSTVEITLVPDGDGTLLRLVHRDLPAGTGERHDEGWLHYLARLAIAAAGDDPGIDPWTQGEAMGL